ncbi:MAG: alpha/beta hydrolase [Silicimonas sp.]|nr:alpha/beta hydrolase [Silicimonas sp.]
MSAITKCNVQVSGTGSTPLVFVHGYGCDQDMWRFVAPAFSDTHKTVLYDLTGIGESDSSAYDFPRYASLEAHAEDLGEILTELDLSDAIVVGHSVGATIACLAALRSSERIKALVLVAPSPCFINHDGYTGGFDHQDIQQLLELMEMNYFDWAQYVTPLIAGEKEAGETANELTRSFCRTDPAISKHFGRVTFLSDHRDDMSRVTHNALILQCSDDALAPTDVGAWLAKQMRGGQLREIEATGHCPHMTEPAKTIAEIRNFLE